MTIRCPHCQHAMELKGAKPGVFHPRCVACKEKFLLQIFDDPNRSPMVAIEDDPNARTHSPMTATVASPKRAVPSTVQTAPPAPASAPAVARDVKETSVAMGAGARTQVVQGLGAATEDLDSQIVGATIGGYHIAQKLGAGGMGAVYLAKQISLDRNVALKVLDPTLANDPQFVARFTREAYAAAQLAHHNVVQIHDIGAQDDLHFFSMEFVEGKTLARMVDDHGRVDAEQAVGLILHAARGLRYAHDHGLIHRDIKPENLMLNDSGIVKVADLGLVKRRGFADATIARSANGADASPITTQANMSMGTPAYMSPEQATDAAKVDQRADIYSLGCTMYDLLTGRPPFVGRTAMEVITKHQREPVVPPDKVVRNVPRSLSEILLTMIAKRPEERYQTMGQVITALEDFLGVATTGPFTPTEEHTKTLEAAVARFNKSKWATIRKVTIALFFLMCAALAVFVGMTRTAPDPVDEIVRKIQWTGAFVGLAVLTTLWYFLISGVTQRTHLFMKVRQLVLGSSIGDWILWTLVGLGILGILIVFKQLLPWVIVFGIACVFACAFHLVIDRALSRERQGAIAQVESMLKSMRLRGLDENSIRQFVCRYAGKHWEAFYEQMFGYEAKLVARRLWGPTERGRERPKFGAWRDPVIRSIEGRIAMRRELRERRLLARVEAKALRAKGIREDLARRQANKNARELVNRAEKLRSTSSMRAAKTIGPTTVAGRDGAPGTVMVNHDVMLEGAIAAILKSGAMAEGGLTSGKHAPEEDEDYDRLHESWFKRRYGTPIDLICAPVIRVILAIIVLGTFTLWFNQNSRAARQEALDLANRRRTFDVTAQITDIKGQIVEGAKDVANTGERIVSTTRDRPLQLFPDTWETMNAYAAAFGGWNAGLAGLLLLVSAFFKGRMMSLIVVLSAAITMVGHHLTWELPLIGGTIRPWMSAAAGLLLWAFAVMFFRDREGY